MIETDTLGSATSTLRDAAERFAREGRGPSREALHDVGEIYEQAGTWLQDNYGKAIAVLGVVAIAGAVGYMLGRNSQMTSAEITHHS